MNKLFEPVQEGHDPKNRIVFICKDAGGFYVHKPRTGFKSGSWPVANHPDLLACFQRQCSDSHNHAQILPEDVPAPVPVSKAATKKAVNGKKKAGK
ncbi:MAG TPA: hypothetical protein PKE07_04955 [Lacibacter sp.]|nr:hypothetical protein [Lacibacter sp.]HMO89557.1 hypothetical protein [Lacibacter sp.]